MTTALVVEKGVPTPSSVAGVLAAVPHVEVFVQEGLLPPLAAAAVLAAKRQLALGGVHLGCDQDGVDAVLVVVFVVVIRILPRGFHLHQPLLALEHVQRRLRLADPELVLVRPLEVRAEVDQVHPLHGAGASHDELLLRRAPVPAAVGPPLDEPLQHEAEVRHLVRPRAARPRGVGLGDAVVGPVHDAVVLDEPAARAGRVVVGRFTPRVLGVVRRGERHGGDLEIERGHQAVVD
mmetsp:Transcript_7957/g.18170  ORF Transcript_7957/g.18170 Transcript_7957/m.18170 type:complete len:235 (-) Transcript_7957:267-971(-)